MRFTNQTSWLGSQSQTVPMDALPPANQDPQNQNELQIYGLSNGVCFGVGYAGREQLGQRFYSEAQKRLFHSNKKRESIHSPLI